MTMQLVFMLIAFVVVALAMLVMIFQRGGMLDKWRFRRGYVLGTLPDGSRVKIMVSNGKFIRYGYDVDIYNGEAYVRKVIRP